MAYTIEERETVIRYDEMDDCWYFESNVRKHMTKILKMEHALEDVTKEYEGEHLRYISGTVKDLENFRVNPFVKNKTKRVLTEEQKEACRERAKKIWAKKIVLK